MRYLKAIMFLILSLVLLFLVTGLFMPSEYQIEKSVVIDAPLELVYTQCLDLNNYNQWNTWYEEEPSAYLPIEMQAGVGQVSKWNGDVVGTGKITVTKDDRYSHIEKKLEFEEPFESVTSVWYDFEEINGKTSVVWSAGGDLSYPIEVFMKVMIESNLSNDFNHGLTNLKKRCEEMKKEKNN
ncbi:MAG: SRPBCC family protein [Candidatus Kapaibacterium sp.]